MYVEWDMEYGAYTHMCRKDITISIVYVEWDVIHVEWDMECGAYTHILHYINKYMWSVILYANDICGVGHGV